MKYKSYWIMFTGKGELAVDEHGVDMKDYLRRSWEIEWDNKNPNDAPHRAVQYSPVNV